LLEPVVVATDDFGAGALQAGKLTRFALGLGLSNFGVDAARLRSARFERIARCRETWLRLIARAESVTSLSSVTANCCFSIWSAKSWRLPWPH
jgi:hypothetical protein